MKGRGPLSIRTLVLIMLVVVILGVLIARSYYGRTNASIDPRIRQAREMYETYDGLARTGDFQGVFALLDSIESIYIAHNHYRHSFEIGVLENNRAAALLTLALYRDSLSNRVLPFSHLSSDSLVSRSELYVRKAIFIYENFDQQYQGKTGEELELLIAPGFREGLESYSPDEVDVFKASRIKEIQESILENKRRLSVCYTNLGLVYRHRGEYQEAVRQYEQALALWDRNLEAENNLNKLLGRPLKKRNLIQKLFPPERAINE
jgi:tetratricopeptide (TPR) repeat protein